MSNLGQMMVGGNRSGREKDDFYPTPAACTLALITAEGRRLPSKVREPACGDGAIARLIAMTGREVVATDLVDREHERARVDFLNEPEPLAMAVVTNPPFVLAEAFIRQAHGLGLPYVAMLLKSTFWHADRRRELFNAWRPARVWALTWRPDFMGRGAPTMDCIWCVWDGNPEKTEYALLPRRSVEQAAAEAA